MAKLIRLEDGSYVDEALSGIIRPGTEIRPDVPAMFEGLDGISFVYKLEAMAARCESSPDPFTQWVGARLFRGAEDRALFLDAKSPEEFDDRDEAAREADHQAAIEKGRVIGSGATFAPDCGD